MDVFLCCAIIRYDRTIWHAQECPVTIETCTQRWSTWQPRDSRVPNQVCTCVHHITVTRMNASTSPSVMPSCSQSISYILRRVGHDLTNPPVMHRSYLSLEKYWNSQAFVFLQSCECDERRGRSHPEREQCGSDDARRGRRMRLAFLEQLPLRYIRRASYQRAVEWLKELLADEKLNWPRCDASPFLVTILLRMDGVCMARRSWSVSSSISSSCWP